MIVLAIDNVHSIDVIEHLGTAFGRPVTRTAIVDVSVSFEAHLEVVVVQYEFHGTAHGGQKRTGIGARFQECVKFGGFQS